MTESAMVFVSNVASVEAPERVELDAPTNDMPPLHHLYLVGPGVPRNPVPLGTKALCGKVKDNQLAHMPGARLCRICAERAER